jgi:hypothetical protein
MGMCLPRWIHGYEQKKEEDPWLWHESGRDTIELYPASPDTKSMYPAITEKGTRRPKKMYPSEGYKYPQFPSRI